MIFALFGLVWILATDYLAPIIFPVLEGDLLFQIINGLLFVFITSVLILFLSRNIARQVVLSNIQEYRTRTALSNLGEVVFLIDPRTFAIKYCNMAVENIFGYSPIELIEQNASILFIDEPHFIQYAEVARRELEESGYFEIEMQMKRKDGRIIDTQQIITALPRNGNREDGIIAITRDITERKILENKREQLVTQLRSLRRIDQIIISFASLEMGQQQIVQEAINNLDVDAAALLTLNESENRLAIGAYLGFSNSRMSDVEIRLGEGLAGTCALERRSLNLADLHLSDIQFTRQDLAAAENFHGYACSPMIGKGKVIGVLEVYRREGKALSRSQAEFLDTLAEQAALVIDSLSTYRNLMTTSDKLRLAYDANIEGWSRALDYRDNETFDHTLRVTSITVALAEHMDFPTPHIPYIRWGSLLHDIGKIGVPDRILFKPGKLNAEEWEIMKKHPEIARDLLTPINFLQPAIDIPYCHQERWDGSGYPRGLTGEEIPLEARIFSVVDVWDALRSNRPYREQWSEEKTLDYLREVSGILLDPEVVDTFIENRESLLHDT